LALAIHNYEDANGHLPPWAVIDPKGKPLLSWRVLILPYIEQEKLYNQFHLDEPWDSPHNLPLLDQMPSTYAVRSWRVKPPPNTTYFQVFVGKGTPFEPGRIVTLNDFHRGPSETLLFVEAANPVPWTKPEDIPYDPDAPLPQLGGVFPDIMRSATADGFRKTFKKPLDESEIRAMITID
jgi:hypothetical protein